MNKTPRTFKELVLSDLMRRLARIHHDERVAATGRDRVHWREPQGNDRRPFDDIPEAAA